MARKSKRKKQTGFVEMQCKYCDNICPRVDAEAKSVTCSKCVHRLCEGEILEVRK
jgi:ribosomal protein S27E